MSRTTMPVALVAILALAVPSKVNGQMHLTIHSGRISLGATGATVQQILGEWARIGQTTIVNADAAPDEPITLQLENVPEGQALDILLRSVGGYIAVSRPVTEANRSRFARVIVVGPRRASAANAELATDTSRGRPGDGSAELAAALADPDPDVRIRALDRWAEQPGDTLDPVTHALVDPDESVRARAQALLDEVLARPR
jgi:hypothetical protein